MHAYTFDSLGRVLHDRVTTLGTNIDGAVRRTSTTYEVRGMVERITQYDHATVGSGSVVNEVLYSYNDLGMLEKEYQEHAGAKDGSTLYVQYNFDTTASGGEYTRGLRPASVRYPNGRLVHFTYGSTDSMADVLNRLDAMADDSGGSPGDVLASYSYLGLGTVVVEDYEQPEVRLQYYSGGSYAGFDRFGRVVDHTWYDYGASANRDEFTYGYDRASNRLYRENTSVSGQDDYYTYDDVNRLSNYDRGDLNANKDAISGTPTNEEDWGLDMTGNWSNFTQKSSGTTDLDQDRTHNEVNEITAISETTGTAWADPVHDRAGNMTTAPKPSDLASGLTCTWDAWNHLVEVKDGATVVAVYEYDGLARRVKKHLDSQSPDSPDGIDAYAHYFYNSGWQVLETRRSSSENTGPESLQPQYQYVWSPRYIDAPVLRDENTDADGLCDDGRIYYLGDANFNVTTLLDTAGDALERHVYSPYGVLVIYDATWANIRSDSSYDIEYTYTGRRLDLETGLYYYRHRIYDAPLGRFASRDPVGYASKSRNVYLYVSGKPLMKTDPTGEFDLLTGLMIGSRVPACGSICVNQFFEGTRIAPEGFVGAVIWSEGGRCRPKRKMVHVAVFYTTFTIKDGLFQCHAAAEEEIKTGSWTVSLEPKPACGNLRTTPIVRNSPTHPIHPFQCSSISWSWDCEVECSSEEGQGLRSLMRGRCRTPSATATINLTMPNGISGEALKIRQSIRYHGPCCSTFPCSAHIELYEPGVGDDPNRNQFRCWDYEEIPTFGRSFF